MVYYAQSNRQPVQQSQAPGAGAYYQSQQGTAPRNNVPLYIGAIAIVLLLTAVLAYAILHNGASLPSITLFQTNNVNARQQLASDLKLLSSAQSYQANYDMAIPSLSSELSYLSTTPNATELKLVLLKYNGESKAGILMGSYSSATYYLQNGGSVTCSQGGYLTTGITCNYLNSSGFVPGSYFQTRTQNATFISALVKVLNQTNVTYLGQQHEIGRQCDGFKIVEGSGEVSGLLNETVSVLDSYYYNNNYNGSMIIHTCLDSQTGIPLSLNITNNYYSMLLSLNNTFNVLRMNATGIDTSVPSEAVTIPVPFATTYSSTVCTNRSVKVTFISLENTTNSTIRIDAGPYSYYSNASWPYTSEFNLGKALVIGNSYTANVPFKENITTASYPYISSKMCINGYCSSLPLCYVYSNLTPVTPYYYNHNSTYNFTLTSNGKSYNGIACDSENVYGTSASCSVPKSSNPGVFCWAATGLGRNINSTAWSTYQEAYNSSSVVAASSKPYSGTVCNVNTSTSGYDGSAYGYGGTEVAGLSVNSSSAGYGGESAGSANGVGSYTFNYTTDSGTQPEAVALLVNCGAWACGTFSWPSGCTQKFLTPSGNYEGLGLALCNQEEGTTYSVTGSRQYYGESVPVSYVITDIRFKNATWGT